MIAIGSDHAGYHLKEGIKQFLKEMQFEYVDLGTDGTNSVDYPDFGMKVAEQVSSLKHWRGILICATGIGMSIVANKIPNIRAAVCHNREVARLAREHNDANILIIGSKMVNLDEAKEMVKIFLTTQASGGRHARRIGKIKEIERKYLRREIKVMNREVMDERDISSAISRLASEILEENDDLKNLVMVGIRTRGVPLAHRLAKEIGGIPVGVLDINLYRDDLTTISQQPIIRETEIPFDINEKKVILVDDVLYTGRTVRCALDALVDFGRPRAIQLAVLVDRGHRELPIQADFVGMHISTSQEEFVKVKLKEVDGYDKIIILKKE